MINLNRLIDNFIEDITIDSESFNEGLYGDHIKSKLIGLGFEIIPDDTGSRIGSNGNNIIARRLGEKEGPYLGLCAHLDTVKPGVGITAEIIDDVIYSAGDTILGADDKAGINMILEVLTCAIENNIPLCPIEVFFSICEESGILGSKDINGLLAHNYYVLDGTGDPGEVLISGPANNQINISVQGKPAHAGLCPEAGISAIEVVSSAISKMNLGRIDKATTANIGTITGGVANNIVCPSVSLTAEVRSLHKSSLDKQTNHMKSVLDTECHDYGAKYDYSVDTIYDAFSVASDDSFLVYTQGIIKDMNLPYAALPCGGGSDANHLSSKGVTPLILGIGIKDCHTSNEHISLKNLKEGAELTYNLIMNYCL